MIARFPAVWVYGMLFCLLQGCGFEVRKTDPLAHYGPLTVESHNALSACIASAIKEQHRAQHQSSRAPSAPAAGPSVSILLTHAEMNTVPISFNSYHQIYQQELQCHLSYLVKKNDQDWIPPQDLEVRGEQRISNSSPFSDNAEEAQLRQRMCDQAAQQILLQIGQYAKNDALDSAQQ